MNVYQDISKFRTMLNSQAYKCSNGNMQIFDMPYMFCTENIYGYLGSFNIANKSVLTTGSSGDQVLYSLLFGAKDVTCFDINPFAKYIFDLKAAFIKTYTYDQFKSQVLGSIYGIDSLLCPEFYKQVCHNVPKISRIFWDKAFAEGLNTGDVIHFSGSYGRSLNYLEYITNKNVYQKLRQVLIAGNYTTKFITTHLQNLAAALQEDKKFDVILLSNIIDYVDCWEGATRKENYDEFNKIVTNLIADYLAPGGIIQLGYSWQTSDKYRSNNRNTLINKFLPSINLKTKPLPGDETLYYACKELSKQADQPQPAPQA